MLIKNCTFLDKSPLSLNEKNSCTEMPAIIVKEYTWRQTDDAIIINIPLFGNPKNVDLFATKSYVKASYPPFILELFLWGNIIDEESECVLNKDQAEVVFTLKKAEFGVVWLNLVEDLDNQTKKERRIHALQEAQELSVKQAKAKSEKSNRLQKQAVTAQINLDTGVLNQIDARRDSERKEAMKDLENWRSTHENPILMDIEGKEQENRKAYRPALKWFKDESGELKSRKMTETEILRQGTTIEVEKTAPSKETSHTNSDNKPLPEKSPTQESPAPISESESNGIIQNDQNSNVTDSSTSDDSDCSTTDNTCQSTTQSFIKRLNQKRLEKFYKGKAKSQSGPRKTFTSNGSAHMLFKKNAIFDEPKKAVPLPRKTGTIDITFSERMFPTPARESHQVEEQEWLEKQAEARRQTGFIVEDLRPEELDPQWLKDKGDEFFKAGNYLGAISAYTHGIKLSSKMSSLYSNRSAAQYALGNYFKCTEDCSMALELMVPHCQGNLESRVKCHARRGAALCKLSSPQHGIPELEAALKLDPNNLTIKRDILAAKQYFNIQD